jgi:hypothetical protein
LVAVFFVARFLGDFLPAPFFFGDRLADDFLAAFFLVDFLAGDFFAAFFFAMSDGSFRCSAQFVYTVIPQGRCQPGRDMSHERSKPPPGNNWSGGDCRSAYLPNASQ